MRLGYLFAAITAAFHITACETTAPLEAAPLFLATASRVSTDPAVIPPPFIDGALPVFAMASSDGVTWPAGAEVPILSNRGATIFRNPSNGYRYVAAFEGVPAQGGQQAGQALRIRVAFASGSWSETLAGSLANQFVTNAIGPIRSLAVAPDAFVLYFPIPFGPLTSGTSTFLFQPNEPEGERFTPLGVSPQRIVDLAMHGDDFYAALEEGEMMKAPVKCEAPLSCDEEATVIDGTLGFEWGTPFEPFGGVDLAGPAPAGWTETNHRLRKYYALDARDGRLYASLPVELYVFGHPATDVNGDGQAGETNVNVKWFTLVGLESTDGVNWQEIGRCLQTNRSLRVYAPPVDNAFGEGRLLTWQTATRSLNTPEPSYLISIDDDGNCDEITIEPSLELSLTFSGVPF